MRFNTNIRDLIDQSLVEIAKEPWNVFASDLLYFMAREHGTGWIPYRYGSLFANPSLKKYTPNPLSPFTINMRRSIEYGVIPPDELFEQTFNIIAPEGSEDRLSLFMDHVMHAFNDFFLAGRSMKDMFMMLLYVAKTATIFYLHGVKEAPQFALMLMADALLQLGAAVPLDEAFNAMDDCARMICYVYEEQQKKNA